MLPFSYVPPQLDQHIATNSPTILRTKVRASQDIKKNNFKDRQES